MTPDYVDSFGTPHDGSPLGSDPSRDTDGADTSGAPAASPDRALDAGSDPGATTPALTPFGGSGGHLSPPASSGGLFPSQARNAQALEEAIMVAAIQAAERYAKMEPNDEFASGYWTGFEAALRLVAEKRVGEFMEALAGPGVRMTPDGPRYSAAWLDGGDAA